MRDNRRTRYVLIALLLASFTLITLDLRGGGGPTDSVRTGVAAVFGPVQRAVAAVVTPVGNFFGGLTDDEQARLDQLERENAELRLEQRTDDYSRARAQELDALLRVAGLGRYRILPAQVIAVGPQQGFAWTVLIDAGTKDGLKVDQTVLNGEGLVGRIQAVTDSTATVLLLIDPESSIGVRVEGNLQLGIATGTGLGALELKLLDPQAPLAVGDRLVTRGDGSLYVPGVPVGEVLSVRSTPGSLIRIAEVRPYVTITALDLIGVVVDGPRTDPRDAVLPPRPTPSGSAAPPDPSSSASPTSSSNPSPTGG